MTDYTKPIKCEACGRVGVQLGASMEHCADKKGCAAFQTRLAQVREDLDEMENNLPSFGDDVRAGIVDENVRLLLPVSWQEDHTGYRAERAIMYQEAFLDDDGEYACMFTLKHVGSDLRVSARADLSDDGVWHFTIVHPTWWNARKLTARNYDNLLACAKDVMSTALESRVLHRRIYWNKRQGEKESALLAFVSMDMIQDPNYAKRKVNQYESPAPPEETLGMQRRRLAPYMNRNNWLGL